MVFPPFEPDPPSPKRRRFRPIPVRMLLPNVITLLALCAGLTAIRLAFEQRFELAVAAIVLAAFLDAVDGRIARALKGTSRFGAELDSLSDFVNFGVAPAVVLYFWGLHELHSIGWIAALVFAICAGLRLARFNVTLEDAQRPAWQSGFFIGMPAPAAAIAVLFPIYVHFLGLPRLAFVTTTFAFLYTLGLAFLMVSTLPVFSGKRFGRRVPRDMVLPVFVVVVLFFALLISFPWEVLTAGTVVYLASLPFGWLSYREHERRTRAAASGATGDAGRRAPAAETRPSAALHSPPSAAAGEAADDPDRPARLN